MAMIHLTVVTPQGKFFDADAQKVILRTTGGDVCILPNHIDYAASIGDGECRITTEGGDVKKARAAGGILHVASNDVQVIANR
ncbi:MAG: F0F1 ATP synthase subunit epsilon, partial [Clostridia bacterium]|nr:F0F1 ATP synthase subunit epsilon [Clostridia bacterium]